MAGSACALSGHRVPASALRMHALSLCMCIFGSSCVRREAVMCVCVLDCDRASGVCRTLRSQCLSFCCWVKEMLCYVSGLSAIGILCARVLLWTLVALDAVRACVLSWLSVSLSVSVFTVCPFLIFIRGHYNGESRLPLPTFLKSQPIAFNSREHSPRAHELQHHRTHDHLRVTNIQKLSLY